MKISDLNLLEIEVYNGDELTYKGMCNEAPEEIRNQKVKVLGMDTKILKLSLE